jgi:hypothetical protein
MTRIVDRRSSKPRIGAATVAGSSPKFRPDSDGWVAIERACHLSFDDQDRSEICQIVDSFLDWRRFEKEAPFLAEVVEPISQLEAASRALNGACSKLFGGSGRQGDAAFQAQLAIEREWRGAEFLGREKLLTFNTLGGTLVLACRLAREQFEADATPWDGQAWEKMICDLAGFASKRGMPVTIRKDTDKQSETKHSPFVRSVKAIQDHYPPEVPIRFGTEVSLATQIGKVLRRAKENGIDFSPNRETRIPPEE